MHTIRRIFAGSLIAFAGALSLGPGSAPTPALASPSMASKIIIDDPSDGIQCPGAMSLTTLSTLIVTDGQSVTICPGVYTGPLVISASNVKILGKGSPSIGYPTIIPPSNYNGALIYGVSASNLTIKGLYLDGADASGAIQWNATATLINGIAYNDSSGTISNNYIVRMRRPTLDGTLTGIGIQVNNTSPTTRVVKVLNNTIFDYQQKGIEILNNVKATVTKNVILTFTTSGPQRQGIRLDTTPGGTVSANTISADRNYELPADGSAAIRLNEVVNTKVSGNKISNMYYGVHGFTNHTNQDLTGNTISGNTILNTVHGIFVQASATGSSTADAVIGNNKISGNKITDYALRQTGAGISLRTLISGGSYNAVLNNNTISGNTILGYDFTDPILTDDVVHTIIKSNKTGRPIPGN